MKLYFKSCRQAATINTNGKNFEDLFNEIEGTIKNFYANNPEKNAPFFVQVTQKTDDHDNVLIIGKRLSADTTGKIVWESWTNDPWSRKLGKGYLNYSRYCESAWWAIVSLIIHHFIGTASDLIALNEAEEEAEREEIANTLYNEAADMAEAAKKAYYEAKRLSERMGTYLHYTDDPDAEHEELVNMAMEMREKLYQIKKLREDFLDRADDLTECDCCMEDFMSMNDMTVDGWDLKYDDPDDIFSGLWNEAWRCFDGDPDFTQVYNAVLYGIAA